MSEIKTIIDSFNTILENYGVTEKYEKLLQNLYNNQVSGVYKTRLCDNLGIPPDEIEDKRLFLSVHERNSYEIALSSYLNVHGVEMSADGNHDKSEFAYVTRYSELYEYDIFAVWHKTVVESVLSVMKHCPDLSFQKYRLHPLVVDDIFVELKDVLNYDVSVKENMVLLRLVSIKICELILTLHRLADSRLLLMDTETNGLQDDRQPVQISYIKTDFDLNIMTSDNMFIEQSFLTDNVNVSGEFGALSWDDSDVVKIHGLTTDIILSHHPLNPSEAYDRYIANFSDGKTFLVGHNVKFDDTTLQNLAKSAGRAPTSVKFLCTYQNRGIFIALNKDNNKLGTIVTASGIDSTTVISNMAQIFGGHMDDEFAHSHNAMYDATSLYLLLNKWNTLWRCII